MLRWLKICWRGGANVLVEFHKKTSKQLKSDLQYGRSPRGARRPPTRRRSSAFGRCHRTSIARPRRTAVVLAAVLLGDFQDAKRDPRCLGTGMVAYSGLTPAIMPMVAQKRCTGQLQGPGPESPAQGPRPKSLFPAGRRFAEKEPRIQLQTKAKKAGAGSKQEPDSEDDEDDDEDEAGNEADGEGGSGDSDSGGATGGADPATNHPAQRNLSTSSELGGGKSTATASAAAPAPAADSGGATGGADPSTNRPAQQGLSVSSELGGSKSTATAPAAAPTDGDDGGLQTDGDVDLQDTDDETHDDKDKTGKPKRLRQRTRNNQARRRAEVPEVPEEAAPERDITGVKGRKVKGRWECRVRIGDDAHSVPLLAGESIGGLSTTQC